MSKMSKNSKQPHYDFPIVSTTIFLDGKTPEKYEGGETSSWGEFGEIVFISVLCERVMPLSR